jgi:hypothetical protein
MKIYTINGRITTDSKILYKNKEFFRKMTNNSKEIELCKLLMKNPHKNIVKI